jgi:hypothetical protein
MLFISLEDNGIGREKAKLLKTSGTQKGLQIINSQMEIYNQFNEHKIHISVEDLKDKYKKSCGTKFSLQIPNNYSFEF